MNAPDPDIAELFDHLDMPGQWRPTATRSLAAVEHAVAGDEEAMTLELRAIENEAGLRGLYVAAAGFAALGMRLADIRPPAADEVAVFQPEDGTPAAIATGRFLSAWANREADAALDVFTVAYRDPTGDVVVGMFGRLLGFVVEAYTAWKATQS